MGHENKCPEGRDHGGGRNGGLIPKTVLGKGEIARLQTEDSKKTGEDGAWVKGPTRWILQGRKKKNIFTDKLAQKKLRKRGTGGLSGKGHTPGKDSHKEAFIRFWKKVETKKKRPL